MCSCAPRLPCHYATNFGERKRIKEHFMHTCVGAHAHTHPCILRSFNTAQFLPPYSPRSLFLSVSPLLRPGSASGPHPRGPSHPQWPLAIPLLPPSRRNLGSPSLPREPLGSLGAAGDPPPGAGRRECSPCPGQSPAGAASHPETDRCHGACLKKQGK